MRHFVFLFALALYLCVACAPSPSPHTDTSPGQTPIVSTAAPAAPTATPLSISIAPDFTRSFRSVVGRAPFTLTVTANAQGGDQPGNPTIDIEKEGQAEQAPLIEGAPSVLSSGVYTVTARVKDDRGTTAEAERRIVVLDDKPVTLPNWKYGVTAAFDQRRAGYYPTIEDVARASTLARQAGVQAIRVDMNWDRLNPTSDAWQWDDFDAMVGAVRSNGLDVIGVLDYSSWWASSAQDSSDWRIRLYSPPKDVSDFAHYAYQVVSHYRNDIHVWQVWNEPNTSDFWKPRPDAARYTALLKEAYLAIKYADPSAVVVFGGLSGNGIEGDDPSGWASHFIQGAYDAGARGFFDVMAIHPFMLPNSGIDTVRARIVATRDLLNQNGDGNIPIWLTEIGVPSNAPWWPTSPIQSEANQADWLGQVFTQLWDETPTIFWYSLQDRAGDASSDAHFGLLSPDYKPKPAYDKLRTVTGAK